MSFKTTLLLAAALLVVVAALFVANKFAEDDGTTTTPAVATMIKKPLVDPNFGETVKITVEQQDQPRWVFECTNPEETERNLQNWRMTEPADFPVLQWQMTSLAGRLTALKFERQFEPGKDGKPTADEAGFNPARTRITIESREGNTAVINIGNKLSEDLTYIQRGDGDTIYIVEGNLGGLLRKNATEYRDRTLLAFKPADVTELSIVHRPTGGAPTTYAVTRGENKKWIFTSPWDADADTKSIDTLITSLSKLSASEWEDGDTSQLSIFGLEKPLVSVTLTIEEPMAATGEDSDAEDGESAIKHETKSVTLHISDRSPIGKSQEVFAKLDDTQGVGRIARTILDKATPGDAWRDMRLQKLAASQVESITIKSPAAEGELSRTDTGWKLTIDGAEHQAELERAVELLRAVEQLKAVSFLNADDIDADDTGFDDPAAEVTLHLNGGADRTIIVGNYTESRSKKLRYVKLTGESTAAKVRSEDVEPLLRLPITYVDHTIFNIDKADIDQITLSRGPICSMDGKQFTIARAGGTWSIINPASMISGEPAKIRSIPDRIEEVVDQLAKLHAESIAGTADSITDIDFTKPDVYATVTTKQENRPVLISVFSHDGKTLARRSDSPLVYVVSDTLFENLTQEFHDETIFSIEASQVTKVQYSLAGEPPITLIKVNDQWQYELEPDLPLDPKKVANYILQIGDIKTARYVTYQATVGLDQYGLDDPAVTLSVTTADGEQQTLLISNDVCPNDQRQSRYAMIEGSGEIFLMAPTTVDRIKLDLGALE